MGAKLFEGRYPREQARCHSGPVSDTKPVGAGLPAMPARGLSAKPQLPQRLREPGILLLTQQLGVFGADLLDHCIHPVDQNIVPADQYPLLMFIGLR